MASRLNLSFDGPLTLRVGAHDVIIPMPTTAEVPLFDRWGIKRACIAENKPQTAIAIMSRSPNIQLPYPYIREMDLSPEIHLEDGNARWEHFRRDSQV